MGFASDFLKSWGNVPDTFNEIDRKLQTGGLVVNADGSISVYWTLPDESADQIKAASDAIDAAEQSIRSGSSL